MKQSLIALAVTAALGLGATSAMAAPPVVPAQPAPLPGTGTVGTLTGDNVYVAVWDATTGASLVEYVGLSAGQISPTDMTASLNFGTLQGYSTTFATSTSSNLRYEVFSTSKDNALNLSTVFTTGNAAIGASQPDPSAAAGQIDGALLRIGDWTTARQYNAAVCAKANPCIGTDFNDTKSFANPYGDNFSGTLNFAGAHTAGTVGSALSFYRLTADLTDPFAATYTTTTYAGTWSLSATGVLTYDVGGGTPVPLPAAAWLLLSGITGLGAIARRRKTDVVEA